jgi:hypothetical protein
MSNSNNTDKKIYNYGFLSAAEKRKEIREWVLTYRSITVTFDSRLDHVVAPKYLLDKPQVAFQYGFGLEIPIKDLGLLEDGIHATLSFKGVKHYTFVPWNAIYYVDVEDGPGIVFGGLPKELYEAKEAASDTQARVTPISSAQGRRTAASSSGKPRKEKTRPSHLRLV